MKFEHNSLKIGQVYLARMFFDDSKQAKIRPVVLMKDRLGKWCIYKVTGRLDNALNHKYGFQTKDWQTAGFYKPSIVKCNKEDCVRMRPKHMLKKIGELSSRDLLGFSEKLTYVQQIEKKKQRHINQVCERR